jgi:peptidoglycan hydrolase CwlO-like protein
MEATVRRIPDRAVRHLIIIATVLSLLPWSTPVFAAPTNARIEAKKAEAAAARAALEDLGAQFEMKVEEYNAVTEALERTRADIDRTRAELATAESRLADAQDFI